MGSFLRNQTKWRLPKRWRISTRLAIRFVLNESGSSTLLKEHEFTITGFVNSSEILSKTIKGVSSAGSGDLSGFAVVPKDAFDSEVYTIARLRYPDLRKWKTTSREYSDKVTALQQALEEKLADNGTTRLDTLKTTADDKISEGKRKDRRCQIATLGRREEISRRQE